MLRAAIVSTAIAAVLATAGCGSECGGICGSECELIDCSYNAIKCDLYASPTPGIVVFYVTELEGGGETFTARIYIDTDGLEKVQGTLLEGQDFLDRVHLTRPGGGQNWHDYTGTDCKIDKGGDEVGKKMSGQCNFKFVNGYFATFNFSCDLQAVDE